MRFQPGDTVTTPTDVVCELHTHTVRLTAGLRLTVLDTRPGDVKILDLDTCDEVWVPAKFVERAV